MSTTAEPPELSTAYLRDRFQSKKDSYLYRRFGFVAKLKLRPLSDSELELEKILSNAMERARDEGLASHDGHLVRILSELHSKSEFCQLKVMSALLVAEKMGLLTKEERNKAVEVFQLEAYALDPKVFSLF